MAKRWGRDRLGRLYWFDSGTGKRVKAPADAERPRAYRKDKRGRGYWTWLDTGARAPRPAWDAVPRWDRAGRPLDSTGRRVPRAALLPEPVLGPPERAVAPPKPGRKKAPKPVRPRVPARARHQIRRADQPVPGFHQERGAYFTRPTATPPKDLEKIFNRWVTGAVHKSPFNSASEIGFRQFGVMFRVRAPLDMQALAELTSQLEGQPVRLVYRVVGHNEWEIWMHLNRPERRTAEVKQRGDRAVASTFKKATGAANIIYDYLEGWEADFDWYEYIETDDDIYEG